ncbi:deoxyribonuclease NucA/NucB [Propionibacteriaceae bacterium ES.041]|nr:hypothetical protein CGZ96_10145 [Enemella evansiae]PFG68333.1 deoxyribonuclease NucA/NucB [Propionibacteriaceae bacterium ES.041]
MPAESDLNHESGSPDPGPLTTIREFDPAKALGQSPNTCDELLKTQATPSPQPRSSDPTKAVVCLDQTRSSAAKPRDLPPSEPGCPLNGLQINGRDSSCYSAVLTFAVYDVGTVPPTYVGDFDVFVSEFRTSRIFGNNPGYSLNAKFNVTRTSRPEMLPTDIRFAPNDTDQKTQETSAPSGGATKESPTTWSGSWQFFHTPDPGDVRTYLFGTIIRPVSPRWTNIRDKWISGSEVRCDNAVPRAVPGCIVVGNVASRTFDRTAYPEYAAHVEGAMISGLPTILTRLTDQASRDANRNTACPSSLPRPGGTSCDEYPFASSYQGAAFSGGPARSMPWCSTGDPVRRGDGSGFSRCMINETQNSKAGSDLNTMLYVPERVLDGEKYVVRFFGGPTIQRNIKLKYDAFGGLLSRLGYPMDGAFCGLKDGACGQRFKGGLIYWSQATGAHPVYGAIGDRYASLGYERSALGLPTSDEFCGLRDGGCAQRFQGGLLYWSPASGASPVWGAILDAYSRVSWEASTLGYPTGTEFCGLKDGGCAQRFQGGMIYWSPGTGSWPVWGRILEYYANNRWEQGRFGYPTSGESCLNSASSRTCTQTFQWGQIVWDSVTGTRG